MANKTIIFDFDGTLVQTLPHVLKIIKKISRDYSLKFDDLTFSDLEKYKDKSAREIFRELNISLLKLPFLARRIRSELAKEIENIKPVAGIKEALLTLKKQSYQLGLLTSNSKENVIKFLQKNKLEVFDFVESESNIFGKDKALKKIVKKRSLDIKNVIYVGDEIRDIEACKKINLPIIAVSWGFNSKKGLLRGHPTFLAEKVTDISRILRNFSCLMELTPIPFKGVDKRT